ncbi:MAG: universal stress protein [Desulfarculaceae bacterium]|nr:universal stress protein [Desulfarculaceae bacterium]MCF8048734.1 universal stress protein [Desulfarculaceae bacterium]MCF8064013.1 universal stress protein [Desulfarculaceae bacterium]MCF8096268.1 universal stress protein [Desulfarculaceae bacterium]MCF8123464.1 universal stress protein [Desulfarculaceae bacterium]
MYKHIVCCLDFSSQAQEAFDTALSLAKDNSSRLTLLHVVHSGAPVVPGEKPRAARRLSKEELKERLGREMRERYQEHTGGYPAEVRLRRGLPSIEILDELNESGADLVVLGAEGLSGVGLVLLGSTAERVSRRASCACLIVRRPVSQ